MTRGNPMAIVRSNAIRLAVVAAIVCGCSFAQDQDSSVVPAKSKWLACSIDWIFTPYDVGSDFSVKLSFHQAPIPGIRVVLTPSGEDATDTFRDPVTAVTDSSGTAHFLAVPTGKYIAWAKTGLFFPSNEVTVHAAGDFDNEIAIRWPLETLSGRAGPGQNNF
jgi:hypothetical protein